MTAFYPLPSPSDSGTVPRIHPELSNADPALNPELAVLGLHNLRQVYYNLPVATLIEHALQRGEGQLANNGALCVETGAYTGRSPQDRFIVDEPQTRDQVDWNQYNVRISEAAFDRLYQQLRTYLQGRDVYVFDGFVGADPSYRFGVRVINELASQNLFAHQLFLRPKPDELKYHRQDFTVIAAPGFHGDPNTDGIRTEAFVILHLTKGIVLIGGTGYAGEIKKSIFSMMNYAMTKRGVLPMHAAANVDRNGEETALFFGLSGTGKTSLSADSDHQLIGDDEHGWSPTGLFNFEGGCYAKTIRLSAEQEPEIWSALRFGALLENVDLDPYTRAIDYDSSRLTENTRAAYPIDHIASSVIPGIGNHPTTIILLTADAFGVLPPIAKLTRGQAMYYFLSGYTSKLAGTERGVTTPQATFSACFGQCFFPLSPIVYTKMLGERLRLHPETQVYLINTGWVGGSYGVGQRIPIRYTKAMVSAALHGDLEGVHYTPHPIFHILMPEHVPGVPSHLLDPRQSWEPSAYDQQAEELAKRFIANFQQFGAVDPEILAAAPIVSG